VVTGDTLWDIAQDHGVTLDVLLAANPQIRDRSLIRPGDRITIPGPLTAIVDTLGAATPAVTFGVPGSGGVTIYDRQNAGPLFSVAERTLVTEIGGFFAYNRAPLRVEIRPSVDGVPDVSTVLATFELPMSGTGPTVSYVAVTPGVVLPPGTYFAMFASQTGDVGSLLGTASVPFEYRAGSTPMGFLDAIEGTSSASPSEYIAVRILGRALPPTLDVKVTVPTWWLHRDDRVSVTARTRPGVPCTLSLQWVNSGASGPIPTEPATIGTRTANAEGIARWGWTVNPPHDNDEAWVTVTCRDGDLSGDGFTAFWVVPSGFEPSANLPPELLGTWVLEWAIQGPGQAGCFPREPCPSVTFVIGPCSLGERCGSLIEADQPGCRYPLVFHRNSAPGDFILNAREDDTAGCDEGWGTGLHFVPTAEGTVGLFTRDGTNVILHRVGPASTTVP